jgi:hypothetical protein
MVRPADSLQGPASTKGKVLIVIGDATETVDTLYPFDRLIESGHQPVIAAPEKRNYQMVMHEVNVLAAGQDTLTAFTARNGETVLTQALGPTSVTTWTAVGDIDHFTMMARGQNNTGNGAGVFFDEMRFGTTLADVTIRAVPEPSRVLLTGLGLGALLLRRRRSRAV